MLPFFAAFLTNFAAVEEYFCVYKVHVHKGNKDPNQITIDNAHIYESCRVCFYFCLLHSEKHLAGIMPNVEIYFMWKRHSGLAHGNVCTDTTCVLQFQTNYIFLNL